MGPLTLTNRYHRSHRHDAIPPVADLYNRIYDAVSPEIDRLFVEGSYRSKSGSIKNALGRLRRAIVIKYPDCVEVLKGRVYPKPKLKRSEVTKLALNTMKDMLDARISVWQTEIPPSVEGGMEFSGREEGFYRKKSLREALNISRYNIFNTFGPDWGPLWGEAQALINVREALQDSNPFLSFGV